MFAKVIVDIASSNVDKIFDYKLNEPLPVGSRVMVPFGNRKMEGYIIALSETTELDESKIKAIEKPLDPFPVITDEQFKLADFMRKRFHIGYADCIRLFLPSELRSGKVGEVFIEVVALTSEAAANEYYQSLRKTAIKQKEAIEYLLNTKTEKRSTINKMFGASAIKKLIEENIVVVSQERRRRKPYEIEGNGKKQIKLTPLQNKVISSIQADKNRAYLLHGITGSGKTEVYMQVIKDVLKDGKTAMMLVPEISLTPQVLMNFRNRFGDEVAIIHSGLSAGERFDEWQRILMGEAKIVVGARSAIFMPLSNIGVIVVDEEHEQSYNSESHPRYVTSEIAEFRRDLNQCVLILGSATPSLISYHKAITGKYQLLEMLERANGQKLPPIEVVDMTNEIRLGNPDIFSNALKVSMDKCLKAGNQAILFLNRRGYASFVQCKDCGYVTKCPDCDVSLALHKTENVLKCHYCGGKYRVPDECPECKSHNLKKGSLGTEKIEEEVNRLFPGVKVLRMDNDTTRGKDGHLKIIEKFRAGEAQVLIGTQMVAKGHDFPAVTLVGIINPDMGLYQSSFSASEKSFALVTQVAGRAGRADKNGTVILQSYSPYHYVYRMATGYDYLSFYKKEINIREITQFPPFCVIVRILLTSLDEALAIDTLKEYYIGVSDLKEKNPGAFIYLNKMRSPVTRIMNKFRFQLVMRLTNESADEMIDEIFKLEEKLRKKNVQVFIEVNAQDLR